MQSRGLSRIKKRERIEKKSSQRLVDSPENPPAYVVRILPKLAHKLRDRENLPRGIARDAGGHQVLRVIRAPEAGREKMVNRER